MKKSAFTAALFTLLMMPFPLAAQAPVPGERVYALDGRTRVEGTLLALEDSLAIATDEGTTVLRPMPSSIYRYAGRTSVGAGLLKGAGIGALIGAGIGAVIGYSDGDDEAGFIAFTAGEKAIMGGTVLGGAGLLAGAILGAVTAGDRWERVRLQPRVGVGSDETVTLGFTTSF